MGLIVKICGLSTPEAVDAALGAGADMIGLVFFPPSPRYLTLAQAAALAEHARGRGKVTALSVDVDEDGIARIIEAVRPDWLQLHGHEPPEQVLALKRRFGLPVMKAIGIRDAADLAQAEAYRGLADRLLLDAKPPKGATRPGGNALAFDWAILDGFDPGMPWMLSGGLDPGNVGEAVRRARPTGVDVSSGVETAPGKKDVNLIAAFVAAARAAERG
ncbi:MAG TPA: phosphoribosylanthranilate isomerase [Bauldia sp.]|nr:phosphoribosylanthranilate isomerase [Bauldia sp.]